MRQTITTVHCDLCRQVISDPDNAQVLFLNLGEGAGRWRYEDVCGPCRFKVRDALVQLLRDIAP